MNTPKELVEQLREIADDLDALGHHWRANRIREAALQLSPDRITDEKNK